MIVIELERPLRERESIEVRFSFTLTLFEIFMTDLHPHGNFGYGSQVMQCGEFFPTLTPWVAGEGFRRWKYHRIGDPYLYSLADFSITVTAPPEIVVAAYGQVSTADGTWEFESLNARSWAFTASPDYRILRGGTENLPVKLYYTSDNTAAVEACLLTAERSVSLFSELFGPYAKRELVAVENAYYSSMEYTGFISISGSHMETYLPTAPYRLVYVVAHEVAHQWWYGTVGTDQILEPWLDEGLATFSEYLFFRNYHPELAEVWRRATARASNPAHFVDDPIFDFEVRSEYINTIYRTAPDFIYELSIAVGEERFLEFLREFARRQTDTFAGAGDFFRLLREYTDADVSDLTGRYFRRPPDLLRGP
jgi:aminopeptidase N